MTAVGRLLARLEARYALLLALLCLVPLALTGRYELQIANTIFIYIVIAVGLNITLGYSGQVSVAQSALAAVGAYASALLVMKLSWPFVPAALVGIACAGLVGAIMGLLTFRVRTHYILLVTFGFHIIILIFIRNLTDLTGGAMGLYTVPRIEVFGWQIRTQQEYFYAFVPVTVMLVYFAERLRRSRVGLAMLALKNNEKGARASGISPVYYRILAMTLGAIYAGVGGVMFAFLFRFLGPESFDLHSALLYVLMVVLGGLASNVGVVVAAVFLTVLGEELKVFAETWILIYGLLIIVTVIALPGGIGGVLARVWNRLGRRAPPPNSGPGAAVRGRP